MKKLALALTALAFGTVSASAADLAARPYIKAPAPVVAPYYDWSGFYIGINGGGGWSRKCWDLTSNALIPGGVVTAFTPPLAEGCHDASGGTAGGQIGYRWQASNWVFGLEAQGNWADFKGSNRSLAFAPPLFMAGFTNQSRVEAFGLFTGQIGYAWNNTLFYVKGGAAVTGDRYETFTVPAGLLSDSVRETRWGGTVGAGLEYAFAPNWSVAVEYDHLFMGTRNVTFTTPAGLFSSTDRIRQDVDLATVRINYRWGGAAVARY